MLVISKPQHFKKVTWMRNPFKPLFSSEDEDVIETSAAVVLGSVSLGFALLGLIAFIFG